MSPTAEVVSTSYFYPYEAGLEARRQPVSGMFDPGLSSDWGDLRAVDPFAQNPEWSSRRVESLGTWVWQAEAEAGAHRPEGTSVELDPSEYSAEVLRSFFEQPSDTRRAEILSYREDQLNRYFQRLIGAVGVDYAGVHFGETDYIYWGKSTPDRVEIADYVNEAIRMKLRAFDEKLISDSYRTLIDNEWNLGSVRELGVWEWRGEVLEDTLLELDPSTYSVAMLSPFFSLDEQTRSRVLQFREQQLNKLSRFLNETVIVNEQGVHFGDGLYLAWLGEWPGQVEAREWARRAIMNRLEDFDSELFTLSTGLYVRNAWDLPAARQLGVWEWQRQSRDGLMVKLDPSDYGASVLQTFFEIGDNKRARFLALRDQRLGQYFDRVAGTLYVNRRGIYFDGKPHLIWRQGEVPNDEEIAERTRNLIQAKLQDYDAELFKTAQDPFVKNNWDLVSAKRLGPWEWESYFEGSARVLVDPTTYDEKFLKPFFSLSPEHQQRVLQYRNEALNALFRKLVRRTYVDRRGLWVDGKQRHEIDGVEHHLAWAGNSLADAGVKEITRKIFEQKIRERDEQIFYTSKVIADKNEVAFIIKAQGVAVFWLPNVKRAQKQVNIRGGSRSVTMIVGKHRGMPELDIFVNKMEGDHAQFMPVADVAPYLMLGFMRGHDYFRDREQVQHYEQMVSMYVRNYSPVHEAHMIVIGNSYPPVVSGANTYRLREVSRQTLANIEDWGQFVRAARQELNKYLIGVDVARQRPLHHTARDIIAFGVALAESLPERFRGAQQVSLVMTDHFHARVRELAEYLNLPAQQQLDQAPLPIRPVRQAVSSAIEGVASRIRGEYQSFVHNFYSPITQSFKKSRNSCSAILNRRSQKGSDTEPPQ
jgi:hypothetical protein